jgi:protein SCO1/2
MTAYHGTMFWLPFAMLAGLSAQALAAPSLPGPLPAVESRDPNAMLRLSQEASGRQLPDLEFMDIRGRPVRLSGLLGKPLVISLIYTSCYHTCPMITQSLAKVVNVGHEALGEGRFTVATIGFDWKHDNPERMRLYAEERGMATRDWVFLSADGPTVAELTKQLGFVYEASPRGFDHTVQATVVDASGRVYRQVYGESFEPPALVEPLKELVFGRPVQGGVLSGWMDGVRLWCTVYDPRTGRYHFDYSYIFTIAAGVISLGLLAAFIVGAWRDSRRASARR